MEAHSVTPQVLKILPLDLFCLFETKANSQTDKLQELENRKLVEINYYSQVSICRSGYCKDTGRKQFRITLLFITGHD